MAASGSGGEAGRPWTATSTWAPAGGGAVEDAVSFETSEDDAEASPAGVVLSRPPHDEGGDARPCEVTVSFRGKYEIHRVYVRSAARIYEIYHSTDAKGTSKDYLCTVRCGLAVKESQPSGEENVSQCNVGASTSDKREHETKSVSSNSDEDSWIDVKIPESPMGNSAESQDRNVIGSCPENTLARYEATAEMTDVSPCVSLTVRLLSVQSKTFVHIEEIYIFADPVESTNDNLVKSPVNNMGGSSFLAMLVPGLMQMSKSRSFKIDDRYFSDGSRAELNQGHAMKENSPCKKNVQETGLSITHNSNFEQEGIESGTNTADSGSGTVSNENNNKGEVHFKDPNSLSLPVQTTENTQVPLVKDQQVSNTDQLHNSLTNENFTPFNRIERKLDTLLSKVEKMELYCSRLEDSMIKPLGSIEARLQRLEQQFDSFSVDIQSSRGLFDMTNPQEKSPNLDNAKAPLTDRKPDLAVRAPYLSSEDFFGHNVTNENQVNFHGLNMVPRLLVKVPDFISQPELSGERLPDGPLSSVECDLSSEKGRKTSPGLVVKVPEFLDDDDDYDDDDDKVKEEKADFGDNDDVHTHCDTLGKNTVDSSKINGALASALEALLTSTKGTSSSKLVCTAINLNADENINDCSWYSLPDRSDMVPAKDGLCTFGDENLVGTFTSYQEIDSASDTNLSKATLDGKVEINEQNNNLNINKVSFVANIESMEVHSQPHTAEDSTDDENHVNGQDSSPNLVTVSFVSNTAPLDPPQPPTVFESVDNGAQVNENRPAVSLAEFLAARNDNSCKNGNSKSEVCCGNDCAEKLTFESTLESSKNLKNISQLLVKHALKVDIGDEEHFCSMPIGVNLSSYASPGYAASGHNINTIQTVPAKDCGFKNTENIVKLSVAMDAMFCQYSATNSKNRCAENSRLDQSLDESFSKLIVEHSLSDLNSMESFHGGPAKEPVVSTNTTSAQYLEDLLGNGAGFIASSAGKELQNVCDLLYEYNDDMLGMASTEKRASKTSPSLEVLLGESSESEAQISDVEDMANDAGIGSTQLFRTFSSSDDDASSTTEPLVDVTDLTTPSVPCAPTLQGPLVDVADLTNSSLTDAPSVNDQPLADVVDPPNPSETHT